MQIITIPYPKAIIMNLNNIFSKSLRSCCNYCKSHKLLVALIIVFIACAFFGIITYNNHVKDKKKKQQEEIIIKREFHNLSLGDSVKATIGNIPSPNPRRIQYSGNVISQISVEKVYLGKRLIDRMELYFYKEKLYLLIMYINITFEDYNKSLTYNHFDNLFTRNGYQNNNSIFDKWRDYYYERCVDQRLDHGLWVSCFGDKHTDLVLVNAFITPDQPQVILRYYDKDSHYTEDKRKENEILDTAFVKNDHNNNFQFIMKSFPGHISESLK